MNQIYSSVLKSSCIASQTTLGDFLVPYLKNIRQTSFVVETFLPAIRTVRGYEWAWLPSSH